jgi:RND family efflux transporter MFP subunit
MRKFLPGVLVIAAIAFVIGSALWHPQTQSFRGQQGSPLATKTELLATEVPHRRDFRLTAHWFGRAKSRESVKIVALGAGRISSVDAEDETFVKKGALLFTLGGPRIQSRLVFLGNKAASLRKRVDVAKKIVKRKRQSVNQRISSLDELDAATAALAEVQAELLATTQELQRLQEGIPIRAPFAGAFTRRRVSVGQEVERGTELAAIIPVAQMRIEAALFPPRDVHLVGLTTAFNTSSGETLSGRITRVLPEGTSEGKTIVWIEGDDVDAKLKPGEIVSGDILLATHKGALAVPRSALVYDDHETPYLFLKEAEGYKKQRVETGLQSDGWVEIVSGLDEGAEVVTRGAYELYYQDFSQFYKVTD